VRQAPGGPQPVAAPHPPDPLPDEWERRLARVLTIIPRRLRPLSVWLARGLVGRLLLHTTAGLVRVQIFDRSMTLAAQTFTSIFPLIILFGVVAGPGRSASVADLAHLPDTSRKVIDDALSHSGFSAFGVLGGLIVLLSSTSLARALTRAYAVIWSVRPAPAGPAAAWRGLVAVLTLALFAVGTRLLGWLTDRLPLPHLSAAGLLLLTDCAVAIVVPRLLLGRAVPARMLLPGGLAFGIVMLIVRPVGSVYLPRALETSADRYGTIGVAFSYIGWLYVIAFGLLLAVVFGEVVARDEGVLGRFFRHPRPGSPRAEPADPEFMRPG
jgi:membrane protein